MGYAHPWLQQPLQTTRYPPELMARYLTIGLWVFAFSFGVTMSLFWWVAAFHDWRVTIHFAQFGEHWIEGVIFHFAILVSLWVAVEIVRGKHVDQSIKGHITANPQDGRTAQLQSESDN